MTCRECSYLDSKVIESRDLDEGMSIRRRRQCLKCGARFTTYERMEMPHLVVVKKDGRREPFEREKVASGIYRACEKLPVSMASVDESLNLIERKVRGLGEAEVSATFIGELVMEELMRLDDVAYVRFASVYRSFTDIESFASEVRRLKSRTSSSNYP
jgi:transcriptional repressor NrdR